LDFLEDELLTLLREHLESLTISHTTQHSHT
jgi:hypothetical protein